MSLNIKDPEAHRLARAIAQATGQSMARVVTDALRERYAQLEQRYGRASVDEILTIADRVSAQVRKPYAAHGDLLYDDRGLPT
jgi:antitoxin VapB